MVNDFIVDIAASFAGSALWFFALKFLRKLH